MESVSLNQLKTVCNLYLEVEFPYFEELREAFHILDICGCRIEELFQIERWAHVNGDTVTLWPQKNNLQRTITLNEHTQNFKNCIINQTKPFLGRTSYQLQYLFRKLNPYIPIYSGGREISLYCYRYKHIWEAQAAGFTIEEIRLEMGHRTQTPILLYLAAQINSTYYIEPYNPDPLPPGHIDVISEPYSFNGNDNYFPLANPFTGYQITLAFKASTLPNSYASILSSGTYSQLRLFPHLRAWYTSGRLYVQAGLMRASNVMIVSTTHNRIIPVNTVCFAVFDLILTPNGTTRLANGTIKVYFTSEFYTKIDVTNISVYPLDTLTFIIGGHGTYNTLVFWKIISNMEHLNFWDRVLSLSEMQDIENFYNS